MAWIKQVSRGGRRT